MRKIIVLIGLSLILSFLTACTRDLETVSESRGIQPEPILSQSPVSSQNSLPEAEPPLPSRKPLNTELFVWGHKEPAKDSPRGFKSTYQYTSWTPSGEYFVGFYDYGVDVYNTNNEVVSQFYLPENISLCTENGKDLKWDIFVCDSGFYLLPNYYRYKGEVRYTALWQSGDEILISDLMFIDWKGNILLQKPSVIEAESGLFLEDKQVYPLKRAHTEFIAMDLFVISVNLGDETDDSTHYFFIPSEDRLQYLGKKFVSSPIKAPQGIIWNDHSDIWLSTAEETSVLFDSRNFSYLYPNGILPFEEYKGSMEHFASDRLLVLAVDLDVYDLLQHPRNAFGNKWSYYLLYASLDDLQLKNIGEMSTFPNSPTIRTFEQYVIYYDNEGCHIFNTETGESYLRTIDTSREVIGRTSEITGVRERDGELQIILYFMDGDMFGADSGGYLLMTKDKAVFYPQKNYLRINPDCTYYMEIDDETQIFSIKPFLTGDEEGIEISP